MQNLSKAALDLIRRQRVAAMEAHLIQMTAEDDAVRYPDEMDAPADYDGTVIESDPYV